MFKRTFDIKKMKKKCTIGITRVVRVGSRNITTLSMIFIAIWYLMSLL